MKVKLTESKLKQIVAESVKNVLKESNNPKRIGDGPVAPIPRKEITPKYFVSQTLEKLDICRSSLWHVKESAELETISPIFNHKFDGLSEKLEEAYDLVDKAYRIVFEINKIE